MPERTISLLERELAGSDSPPPPVPDLDRVRRLGDRRRRVRVAVAGVGGVGVAAGMSVTLVVAGVVGPGDGSPPVAEDGRELSPLAERALAEIPGAVQVSDSQVVIPAPADTRSAFGMSEPVPESEIQAGPVDVGTRNYAGVTAFQPDAFPRWLYDETVRAEKTSTDDPAEGYPVGSTDVTGISVDAGPLGLTCMGALPQWGGDDRGGCSPAMVAGTAGERTYQWGMGAPGFLKPGEPLQLFSTETFTAGRAQTVWIGGTDGTDVATVDLVATDGSTVEATVASGDLVPGDTMFWGTVDGELALAVTRDADGDVLERHEVQPCSDPVDCEVR